MTNPNNQFYSTHHLTEETLPQSKTGTLRLSHPIPSSPPPPLTSPRSSGGKPHPPDHPRTPAHHDHAHHSHDHAHHSHVDHAHAHPQRSYTLPREKTKSVSHETPLEHGASFSTLMERVGDHKRESIGGHAHTMTARDAEYAAEQEALRKEALAQEAQMTDEQKARRAEHRKKVESEIKATETSYCHSLDVLVKNFVFPLQANASDTSFGVSSEHLEALLSNLETLHKFHQAFLKDLLESEEPASIIYKYGDFFKLYKRYLNGYTACLTAFSELRNNQRFQGFLNDVKQKLSKQGTLDLMSYMIMPVQRVPRYVLLLKELSKYTSPSHSEWQAIEDALLKIKDVTADINEAKRQMENMTRLMEVQSRIQGEFGTLVVPHRRLIREGKLQEMTSTRLFGSLKPEARVFFLFSDILLWTTDSYKFKGYLQIPTATIEDDKKLGPTIISLTTSKIHVCIACKDVTEKENWLKDLREVAEAAKLARGQAMNLRAMKINRRHNHSHEVRSNIHQAVVTGLQKIEITDDGGVDEDKTEEEKEKEKGHEKRTQMVESTKHSLEDLAKSKEAKGASPPAGAFKPRQMMSRRGAPASKSAETLDHHEGATHHTRPSLLGETPHGSSICTCHHPTPPGGDKCCPVHPFG